MDNIFKQLNPRLRGVREQFIRSKWFCELADKASEKTEQFRLLIAALYFARSIIEIMLEAAESQELTSYSDKNQKECRKEFELQLASRLIHYALVEKIRIHDFHRFGCIPPNLQVREMFFGGRTKLTANKGGAFVTLTDSGPKVELTGNSSVKDQRTLCNADGLFFDDVNNKFIPLRQILSEYLEKIPDTITWFEGEMAG